MKTLNKHLIIIGGQRCGSTLLKEYLDQHGDILFASPCQPEPKYFLKPKPNKEFYYKSFFKNRQKEIYLAEKSTSYYESRAAVSNIHSFDQDAKIILIVRNPVNRAISNYFFSKTNGIETRTINDTFLNNIDPPSIVSNISVNPFDYISRGFYYEHLKKYQELFDRNSIQVIQFEKLIESPQNELNRIFDFLNLKQFPIREINLKVNSGIGKSKVNLDVINLLKSIYHQPNLVFAEHANIDLDYWN